jgi:hypothetical protein
MLRYCLSDLTMKTPKHVYILGSAEGTFARTLAHLGAGKIQTLSCSPNAENQDSFFSHGATPFSSFFLGPFHHLTSDIIASREDLSHFISGFDIILEDTTFQMYSPNRTQQIEFVKMKLRKDGLMIFIEKFRHENEKEYIRREMQKDFGFKSRFFDDSEIAYKSQKILKRMNMNENTLEQMAFSIKKNFEFSAKVWNSGNFLTIIASDSETAICSFIEKMAEPCIPSEYIYETIPESLLRGSIKLPSFRDMGAKAA